MRHFFVSIATFALLMTSSIVISGGIDIKTKNAFTKVWEKCDKCKQPESAYYDRDSGIVFVSNVGGDPTKKDGDGTISILKTVTGKPISNPTWVTGLNAPKGLRSAKGKLYVSDIDTLVVIDIKTGKIEKKISVAGAKFLNDVAIDNAGNIYISDTMANKVFKVTNDKVTTFASGDELESPNGLLVLGEKLIVASWGKGMKPDWSTSTLGGLYSLELKTAKKTPIAMNIGHLDGLEVDNNGDYLVSDWMAGKVIKVTKAGKPHVLLYGFKGSADIGYIPQNKELIVPRMGENLITGYNLGKYPNYNNMK